MANSSVEPRAKAVYVPAMRMWLYSQCDHGHNCCIIICYSHSTWNLDAWFLTPALYVDTLYILTSTYFTYMYVSKICNAPFIDVQKCDVYQMIMNCTNKSANSCCCRLNCQSSMWNVATPVTRRSGVAKDNSKLGNKSRACIWSKKLNWAATYKKKRVRQG